MPAFGFNPFSFGRKSPQKVPYPSQPQPRQLAANPLPPYMQPAMGPEIQGRDPPFQMPASATAPPGPPDPSLIPPAPGAPAPGARPPMRLGMPGDIGPKLSEAPPGMGDPFGGASEEEMTRLMELGVIPDQQNILGDQIAQAEALRGRAMPEGRDSGRVYTAANPLEFLGAGLQSWAAHRDLKGGKALRKGKFVDEPGLYGQRDELLDKQALGRKSYFDMVRQRY